MKAWGGVVKQLFLSPSPFKTLVHRCCPCLQTPLPAILMQAANPLLTGCFAACPPATTSRAGSLSCHVCSHLQGC